MEFNEIKSYEEAFIAGYGDGGFRMGENRFEGSMLITPAGFYPWDVQVKEEINLKNLDPIWTTAYITRNHGYMIYDALVALDANLKPQPQMLEKWEELNSKIIK